MKINQNILKQFVEIPENINEFTNNHIIEVDDYAKLNISTNLVIGHVLTCEDHPDSDHLHVTTVDLGNEVTQIVCGAPNVAKGQYVIVATVGAELPGDFKIKASKIRGVESNGMICSLKELGLDEKYLTDEEKIGIYSIKETVKVGSDALEYLGLKGFNMELGLTPNRSDLLSHVGFAYEVASMSNKKITLHTSSFKEDKEKNPLEIKIEADGCYEYNARYFKNVTVKESPLWLKNALIAADIRPINNVVDISNYVLIEYGTPLHMFDAKKVKTNKIAVRYAKKNEKVTTLDEVQRTLDEKDLVITNTKEIIAVAGVMGLEATGVSAQTTEVILEAAYFDPKHIAKTSKKLNLKSDSSLRFERGIDQDLVIKGLERATQLLTELASATVLNGIKSDKTKEYKNQEIKVDYNRINKRIGINLSKKEIIDYLIRLDYKVNEEKDILVLMPPKRRYDIKVEADIIEEIARIYGYDSIPLAKIEKTLQGKLSNKQVKLRALRHLLSNIGLNEIITYSLTSEEKFNQFNNNEEPIKLLMPLASDRNILRQSLLSGMIETLSYNQSRNNINNAFFEIGKIYQKDRETLKLSLGLSGLFSQTGWIKNDLKVDLFVLKGLLEKITEYLGVEISYKQTSEHINLHPGIQANIMYKNEVIGYIGKTHPKLNKLENINESYLLELTLDNIIDLTNEVSYKTISKYPSITRDLSLIISKEYVVSDVMDLIKQTSRKYLEKIELFDVYEGKNIEAGKHSLAFSLVFNDATKTLEKEDVDKVMKSIKNRLEFTFKAELRD
ncbi:Phenylalanyl-tRNA synthetase, beta chain [Alteracholeplasma palmae J233]|uniref:Phenylalanine--tRNA ligase beta subunit n=1 Tax=Alteracholeplasma palmae (strain ATCC 49389 / J233) TaxID=1318466 RepID=U4KK96_ALTPJ|nr:phenylalanine--tRNA ligase subunit beta [Alteracholeplasma palmae]CCV63982.1 Phenylalanyl-tRNA synthetase, beta chain [Alteracholeplasma palmae J233]